MSEKARKAAEKILDNLSGRRGIGNELDDCDEDILDEIVETMAGIIEKAMA